MVEMTALIPCLFHCNRKEQTSRFFSTRLLLPSSTSIRLLQKKPCFLPRSHTRSPSPRPSDTSGVTIQAGQGLQTQDGFSESLWRTEAPPPASGVACQPQSSVTKCLPSKGTKGTAQEVILNLIVPTSFVQHLRDPLTLHPVKTAGRPMSGIA